MPIVEFLICFLFTSMVFAQKGPPTVSGTVPTRYKGQLGDGIRLACPMKADPEPIFEWYRDGERVVDWDRYRFGGQGSSLNIQRLDCEDQGTYVCKAINGFGVHEISFQLDLFDDSMHEACKSTSDEDDGSSKPTILHRPKKTKHWLKPARNYALLKCIAVAEPLPKFYWFKDGVEITADKSQVASGGSPKYVMRSTVLSEEELIGLSETEVNEMEGMRSTLQISDLRGSDSGNYTCRAKNEHGTDEMVQILEVVERQIPRRPEMHPDFPPAHSWVETGETGILSCKVLSDFPPEVHWLKRILPASSGPSASFPILPDEEEVDASHSHQFIANRTLTIGTSQYQILPSVPVKTTPDGYHASVLLLSKKVQEADAGYYVCLALNNAGYNYRQVYLNVTTASGSHSKKMEGGTLRNGDNGMTTTEGWGDKGRADAATTAVVVVVVVCGLAGIVASCFVWKKRKSHLKDKVLNSPSTVLVPDSAMVNQRHQRGAAAAAAPPLLTPLLPAPFPASASDYSAFREGLNTSGNNNNLTPPLINGSHSGRSANSDKQVIAQQHPSVHRVYYLPPRVPGKMSSPRQQHQPQQRSRATGGSSNSFSLMNGGGTTRTAGSGGSQRQPSGHYRSSPRGNSTNHAHYCANPPYNRYPVSDSRSAMSSDTSFHSDSFYPDWSSHPHNIRLPYPSPNNSFDQI